MQRPLSALLRAHHAALKAEWMRRLQAEPMSTPMADPTMLAYLMDETLAQVDRLVRAPPSPSWLVLHKHHLEPLRSACPCGLNPLLAYFSTGGEALIKVLGADVCRPEDEKTRICQAWHFIAQGEIEALCGMCRRVCAPALSFPLPGPQP